MSRFPLVLKNPLPVDAVAIAPSGENVCTSPMNAAPGVVFSRTLWPHTDPTNGETHPHMII